MDNNYILQYWNDIESGVEVVSNKIRRTFKHLVKKLNDKESVYFFDKKRADHVIDFCEKYCKHSKGKFAGKPVILELWEKAILSALFGFVDIDGLRQYREGIIIVAKKNGKSLIASCIGLYLQVADSEGGSEVYAVACNKQQAHIVWKEAKSMVNKSPVLKKRIRTLIGEMLSDFNDGVFRPLASKVDTLDGKNVHGAIFDEIHAWKNGIDLYNIIADGVTAREQPLILITSTAGTVREDLYDMKYDEITDIINAYEDGVELDERMLGFIYELDNRSEWTNPKYWKKANPGLGTIKNFETLKHKVEKAKENPLLVRNILCKEFNIRETSSQSWLTFEQINNTETFDIKLLSPKYAIGGVDLASSVDLTAASIIFRVPNDDKLYVHTMYWLPHQLLEKRAEEDKMHYVEWYEQGLLRTCPGNEVHPNVVTQWFLEIQEELGIYIPYIGYDFWSAKYWVKEMMGYFGEQALIKVIQGKPTLSGPMKHLGADLEANKIIYNNNPITKWCMTNVKADIDKNGNMQPIKPDNRKRRIDGFASMLDAYVVYKEKYNDYMILIE